jgi:Na+/H+-translocating membrane pyrophosphatase
MLVGRVVGHGRGVVLVMAVALVGSYWLGNTSGLTPGSPADGLFGTAVATMGMLSTAAYVLTMDVFGPIADNAGGIVEMSCQPEGVREVTDTLDAVGNTTKATTKGYAIGSAGLASFLLFSAYLDEVAAFTGAPFHAVDIAVPEVFVGGLLGAALVFLFTAWACAAVGRSAAAVVEEVRRQFRERPGIMSHSEKVRGRRRGEMGGTRGLGRETLLMVTVRRGGGRGGGMRTMTFRRRPLGLGSLLLSVRHVCVPITCECVANVLLMCF